MKKVFLLFIFILSLCSCQSDIIPTFSEAVASDIDIYASPSSPVIPIETAIDNLNGFLSDVVLTKASDGLQRNIVSIDTHFSTFRKDVSGNSIPDAYLVNFDNNNGFAVLGANDEVDQIIAVVENGNTTWEEILNPNEKHMDSFAEECPDPGIEPDRLISMCINGALHGQLDSVDIERLKTKTIWDFEKLPITDAQNFNQQLTYCHKNNRRYVLNGCASTAIAIVMANLRYPVFYVDYQAIDYSYCNAYNGLGYKYSYGSKDIYIQLSDYFTNSSSIPSSLTDSQIINLLTLADPEVINKHNDPDFFSRTPQPFQRYRFKLMSGVFYVVNEIVKDWGGTGAMPAAVKSGLEDLGFINVDKTQKSSLTNKQIDTIQDMLENDKPVILCGWSLFGLNDSHYWVVDGLRRNNSKTHIHCNWGWGGDYNGWFSSNCIRSTSEIPPTGIEPTDGNEWNNIIVYSYDIYSMAIHGDYTFYTNMPVEYE